MTVLLYDLKWHLINPELILIWSSCSGQMRCTCSRWEQYGEELLMIWRAPQCLMVSAASSSSSACPVFACRSCWWCSRKTCAGYREILSAHIYTRFTTQWMELHSADGPWHDHDISKASQNKWNVLHRVSQLSRINKSPWEQVGSEESPGTTRRIQPSGNQWLWRIYLMILFIKAKSPHCELYIKVYVPL